MGQDGGTMWGLEVWSMGLEAGTVGRYAMDGRELSAMPGAVKAVENMTKNLTIQERAALEKAQAETLPARTQVRLAPPAYVNKDKSAKRYWRETLARMDGITLLDDLDTEMLAVYCTMLARRDDMNALCRRVLDEAAAAKPAAQVLLDAVGELEGLMAKLQGQERIILQYAEKLGLTPSGRVRLARQRATERVVQDDDDLFE